MGGQYDFALRVDMSRFTSMLRRILAAADDFDRALGHLERKRDHQRSAMHAAYDRRRRARRRRR
jgi:hypothetical protein